MRAINIEISTLGIGFDSNWRKGEIEIFKKEDENYETIIKLN